MPPPDSVRLHTRITLRPPASLKPAARNARTHSRAQIKQIEASIARFGFTNPVLVDDDERILAGHGRVAAAISLGLSEVPVLFISDLTPAERRAYLLADNKLALNAGWDSEILAQELQELVDLEFEMTDTGFSLSEIDLIIDAAGEASPKGKDGRADLLPAIGERAVCRPGELWHLGRHRLLCADARDAGSFELLMAGAKADLVFTDPPYNVRIDGHVCGSGNVHHREFVMGAGEMSEREFTSFLEETIGNAARNVRSGAILFVCMDWRHMRELLEAGDALGLELKNLVVWNKTNGGMGTFYRSKHELIFVFKHGDAPHVNTFGLGDTGRYRTNVWDYAGISSMSATRGEELAMHPTVKPVALVSDALRDCSKRGDLVLDPFAGSGTTLIAAQATGRCANVIEFDPLYCDTITRRFQAYTGKQAVLAGTDDSFDLLEERRLGEEAQP